MSYWTDSIEHPIYFSKLDEDLSTDVIIVGGGIAGVSIAYQLTQSNIQVILIEGDSIGSGETSVTTAHLANAKDDRYYHLEKIFSKKEVRLIAQSHTAAIEQIERIIQKEKINCDFSRLDGYLFLHPSDKKESLEKEFKSCLRAGLDVELSEEVPGMKSPSRKALVYKNQAQFHPLKYLKGLCDAIIKKGGKIFTRTYAGEINSKGIVTDDGFRISANHIVVATNVPVNNKYVLKQKQKAFRTYVIGVLVKKNFIPRLLWWDTGDFNISPDFPPYHYVRIQNYDEQNDLLLCGGCDHAINSSSNDGVAEKTPYGILENWCSANFTSGELKYCWSGKIMEPADSLAFIGRNPLDKENIYVVTGDSGNGMTHAVIAGQLISDLILGIENKLEKIYSPSRFKIFGAGNIFTFNLKRFA